MFEMFEIRSALRGVSAYLGFGFVAAMVAFAIADLMYPLPRWAPAAYALLMVVPGLAAGLTAGGGWKIGLMAGFLGAAVVAALLLAFAGWLGLAMLRQSGLTALFLLAVSGISGAAGGALRAKFGQD